MNPNFFKFMSYQISKKKCLLLSPHLSLSFAILYNCISTFCLSLSFPIYLSSLFYVKSILLLYRLSVYHITDSIRLFFASYEKSRYYDICMKPLCLPTSKQWMKFHTISLVSFGREHSLKTQEEVSLHFWAPVLFAWIQLLWLYWIRNRFTFLVKSKTVKQEVSPIVILPFKK